MDTLLPYLTGKVASCQVLAMQELRRGVDPACVHCLAFSRGDKPDWLALSSDKVSRIQDQSIMIRPYRMHTPADLCTRDTCTFESFCLALIWAASWHHCCEHNTNAYMQGTVHIFDLRERGSSAAAAAAAAAAAGPESTTNGRPEHDVPTRSVPYLSFMGVRHHAANMRFRIQG